MKHLVIGAGEVGTSLYNVLLEKYENVSIRDKDSVRVSGVDILHIAIPYSNMFSREVVRYIGFYRPRLTIVHSTVPTGTCDRLNVVHSPIRGLHPNLEDGIKTFVKYFGGKKAKEAAKIFDGITRTKTYSKASTTEAMKIWSTTYYGWNIIFQKLVKDWCDSKGLDFEDVYTEWNTTYNQGYKKLGYPQFIRPVLKDVPGPIGGHCIVPNLKFIRETRIAHFIKRVNSLFKS